MRLAVAALVLIALNKTGGNAQPFYDRSTTTVLHSWQVVDYDWTAIGITKTEALRRGNDADTAANQFHGAFIPRNNAIT